MHHKILSFITTSVILTTLFASNGYSQYDMNKSYLGPTIGLSFLGSTFQIGANYEYSVELENFGNVGIGGVFRYWSYSENYFEGEWSYTDILVGIQGNYHFKVNNNKLDPWAGLTLAYDGGSVEWQGPYGYNYATPTYGGFFLGAQGGLRYWISPTVALVSRIGFGTLSYGALEVGADFKL